ncbi:hypothetical protein AXG93_3105s1120 [Marchantia polymorpha subsp. ruderalis]|uniref:Uncharacterized protein n=1 Tax=Marchantia polymorpha subsp. ruderalis TaxID=1480154 RepID=A0A176WLE9_MARPO|nr:hypothetical protein AXG93_3105s1120 [Marchantia polymorpha subsp. ruderalis]
MRLLIEIRAAKRAPRGVTEDDIRPVENHVDPVKRKRENKEEAMAKAEREANRHQDSGGGSGGSSNTLWGWLSSGSRKALGGDGEIYFCSLMECVTRPRESGPGANLQPLLRPIDALGRTGQNAMMFALDVKSMPVHPLDHLLLLLQQQQLR